MTDRESSVASGSTGPRRESTGGGRGGREPPTPRAEVNRLAQAAFRQRQKEKVQRLEAQVAALSERIAELHLTQASYRAQVETLQSRYMAAPTQRQQPQLATAHAETRPPGSEDVDDETAAMVARSLHLVQGPNGPPTTAAQCRYLTADLLTGICLRGAAHMRVERARQLLDAGADRPGSNQALQLEIMIRETTRMFLHLWRRNGSLVNRALAVYVSRAGGQEQTPRDLHHRVLAVLRLTNHQREALIAAYGALAGRLAAAKQACGGDNQPAAQQPAGADSGTAGANLVFTTMEAATERCKALDAAKRSAMFEYLSHCHVDVLSPLQVAWGTLAAFPYHVDLFELGAILVAQAREPWPAGEDGVVAELLELLTCTPFAGGGT